MKELAEEKDTTEWCIEARLWDISTGERANGTAHRTSGQATAEVSTVRQTVEQRAGSE